MHKIRFYENLHIIFWLIKDLSWIMIWKPLGIIMIIPTVSFALWFCIKSFKTNEFYVYLSTLFWICANATWMLLEFYQKEEYKYLSATLFIIGIIFMFYYIIIELNIMKYNNKSL